MGCLCLQGWLRVLVSLASAPLWTHRENGGSESNSGCQGLRTSDTVYSSRSSSSTQVDSGRLHALRRTARIAGAAAQTACRKPICTRCVWGGALSSWIDLLISSTFPSFRLLCMLEGREWGCRSLAPAVSNSRHTNANWI